MKERKEVIKHSAAIQIQNNVTLLQRRAWNVLLANAYNELPTEEHHFILSEDLARALEFNSHNNSYLKEALKALVSCSVEWNVLDKDGSEIWGVAALLAEAVIENGVCTYAYAPTFRRILHNPRMYARLSLSLQNKFSSKHALALWELCTDYLGTDRDYGETPLIPLAEYRKLMGIADDMYPLFKLFNQRVVKEPVAEINRVSDFRVTVDYQRRGRKVTALKFKIRRVALLPESVTGQRTLFPDLEDMPQAVKLLKDAGLSTQDAWNIWQNGWAFVEDESLRPAELSDDAESAFVQYIREKIHLLHRRRAAGKVENSTGFLMQAIRHNYANPDYALELQSNAAAEAVRARRERERQVQALEDQKSGLEAERDKEFHALCSRIADASPAILDAAVDALLADNFIFRQRYKHSQSALDNYRSRPLLAMAFAPYLERHSPEPFEKLKREYAARIAVIDEQISSLG